MSRIKTSWIICLLLAGNSSCLQHLSTEQEETPDVNLPNLNATPRPGNTDKGMNETRFVILSGYKDGEYWLLPIRNQEKDSVKPVHHRVIYNSQRPGFITGEGRDKDEQEK